MNERGPENVSTPKLFGIPFPVQQQVEDDAGALKAFKDSLITKIGEKLQSPAIRDNRAAQAELNEIFVHLNSFGFAQDNFNAAEFNANVEAFENIAKMTKAFDEKYFAEADETGAEVEETSSDTANAATRAPVAPPAPGANPSSVPPPPPTPQPTSATPVVEPQTPPPPPTPEATMVGPDEQKTTNSVPPPPPRPAAAPRTRQPISERPKIRPIVASDQEREPQASSVPDAPPATMASPRVETRDQVPADRVEPRVLKEPTASASPEQRDAEGIFVVEGLGEFKTNIEGFHGKLITALNAQLPALEMRAKLAVGGLDDQLEELKNLLNKLKSNPKENKDRRFNNNRDLPSLKSLIEEISQAPISVSRLSAKYKEMDRLHNKDIKVSITGTNHIHSEHIERRIRAAVTELEKAQKDGQTELEDNELEEVLGQLGSVQGLEKILRSRLIPGPKEQLASKEYLHLTPVMESDIEKLLRDSSPEVQQVMTYKLDDFKSQIDQLKVADDNKKAKVWNELVASYQTALRDIYTERAELNMGDKEDDMIDTKVLLKVLEEADQRLEEGYKNEREKGGWWSKALMKRWINRGRLFSVYKEELEEKIDNYAQFKADPEAEIKKLFGKAWRKEAKIKKRDKKYQAEISKLWREAIVQKRKELDSLGLLASLPETDHEDTRRSENSPQETESFDLAENIKDATDAVTRFEHILTLASGVGVDTSDMESRLRTIKLEIEAVAVAPEDDESKTDRLKATMGTMEGVINKIKEEVKPNELKELGPIEDIEQFKAYRVLLKEHLELLSLGSEVSEGSRFGGLFEGRYKMKKREQVLLSMTKLQTELDRYEAILTSSASEEEKQAQLKEQWSALEDHLEEQYAAHGLPYERTTGSVENKEITPELKQYLDRDYRQFIADIENDQGPYAERFVDSVDNTDDQKLYKEGMAVYEAYQSLSDKLKTADQNTDLVGDEVAELESFMAMADALWNKLSPLREHHLAVNEAQSEYYKAFGQNDEAEKEVRNKFNEARAQLVKEALKKLKAIPDIDQATISEKVTGLINVYYIGHVDQLNEKRLEALSSVEQRGLANSILEKVKSNPRAAATTGAAIFGAISAAVAERLNSGLGLATIAGSAAVGNITERRVERFLSNWYEESRLDIARHLWDKLMDGNVPEDDVDRLLILNLTRKDRVKYAAAATGAVAGGLASIVAAFIPAETVSGWQGGEETPLEMPVETPSGPGAPLSPEAVGEVNDIINDGAVAETMIDVEQLQVDFVNDLIEGTRFESTPDDPAIINLKETIFGDSGLTTDQRLTELGKLQKLLNLETIDAATEYIRNLD